MGVPKFFRWAAERYPLIITPFKDTPPPTDNFYLDMNGIIHHCTHPNDIDATRTSPTEKEMVQAIFAYLEKLFAAIQPRKHFVMAIDGCAPRAKMNQQRQRRYRSGYEMMVAREEAKALGQELPEEGDVFDSNSITPGTEFMCRLTEHFEYFIAMKLQQDAAWRNCKIIFSGQDDPGEGEHKIVDFIRRRKSQPDYSPDETHCMYGLDADLMMLALATHEPHFTLLREVVTFNQGTKKEQERRKEDEAKGIKEDAAFAKPDTFVLLHVNLFREYLDLDVRRGAPPPPGYDMERMLDDFVFMCFFVGNDFLPSLPTLAINDNSLTRMLEVYYEKVLLHGGNLVRDGKPQWQFIEAVLQELGKDELTTLRRRREEQIEFNKRAMRNQPDRQVPPPPRAIESMQEFKQRYYTEKLGFASYDPQGEDMQALRRHYIEGISWVLQYYYQGPASWKWFYPHHYTPLISDLCGIGAIGDSVKFELGEPFLPHMQLLAVLPPMSYRSMPTAYHELLLSHNSPLAKYFPAKLEIDKEDARAPWEGIVLIPFIDEALLVRAYNSVQHKLTEQDRLRNRRGKPVYFAFDPTVKAYDVPSPMFGPLRNVHISRTPADFPAIPGNGLFVPRLMPNVRLGARLCEGYASLASLGELDVAYEEGVVNVFGMPTRKESLLLDPIADDAAQRASAEYYIGMLGKPVWVGAPHLKRARVASIMDRNRCYTWTGEAGARDPAPRELTNDEFRAFIQDAGTHQEALKTKCGVLLHSVDVLIYVNRFTGMRLSKSGRFVPTYSTKETAYPAQVVIQNPDILEDPKNVERERKVSDFENGSRILYIGPEPPKNKGAPINGSPGVIATNHADGTFDVFLRVFTEDVVLPEPVVAAGAETWLPLEEAATQVARVLPYKVTSATLSMLCSSIQTSAAYGSAELGLCIKFTGKNLARIGLTKYVLQQYNAWYVGGATLLQRMEDKPEESYHLTVHGNATQGRQQQRRGGKDVGSPNGASAPATGRGKWYFSAAAVALLKEYCLKFAPLVMRLNASFNDNTAAFDVANVLHGAWANRDAGDVVREMTQWIASKQLNNYPMVQATEDSLLPSHVRLLEEAVMKPRPYREVALQKLKPKLVYLPTASLVAGLRVSVPLPATQRFALTARVVYSRETGVVPFGLAGTVARILPDGQTVEVVFDEAFVGGSLLGGRLKTTRGALVPTQALYVLPTPGAAVSPTSPEPAATDLAPREAARAVVHRAHEAVLQQKPVVVEVAPAAAAAAPAAPVPSSRPGAAAHAAQRQQQAAADLVNAPALEELDPTSQASRQRDLLADTTLGVARQGRFVALRTGESAGDVLARLSANFDLDAVPAVASKRSPAAVAAAALQGYQPPLSYNPQHADPAAAAAPPAQRAAAAPKPAAKRPQQQQQQRQQARPQQQQQQQGAAAPPPYVASPAAGQQQQPRRVAKRN